MISGDDQAYSLPAQLKASRSGTAAATSQVVPNQSMLCLRSCTWPGSAQAAKAKAMTPTGRLT